ncbi:MAG: spore coat protein [Clostridia bacterium]|nr:spore coat protein [Clostridia bacterium]NCC69040.1 spore coat protein [Clostridia bacterium]
MDDKTIMENLLMTTKGACDLYMHGAIESSSPNVHQSFNSALNSGISLQDGIYKQMSQKGWYPSSQADQQQISQVRQKYPASF